MCVCAIIGEKARKERLELVIMGVSSKNGLMLAKKISDKHKCISNN